jgi:hypothetical protein
MHSEQEWISTTTKLFCILLPCLTIFEWRGICWASRDKTSDLYSLDRSLAPISALTCNWTFHSIIWWRAMSISCSLNFEPPMRLLSMHRYSYISRSLLHVPVFHGNLSAEVEATSTLSWYSSPEPTTRFLTRIFKSFKLYEGAFRFSLHQ